jgi:hypothetical protein
MSSKYVPKTSDTPTAAAETTTSKHHPTETPTAVLPLADGGSHAAIGVPAASSPHASASLADRPLLTTEQSATPALCSVVTSSLANMALTRSAPFSWTDEVDEVQVSLRLHETLQR